ncbi:MAG: M15 family metallopeptidase [Actinomycetales bacterium]
MRSVFLVVILVVAGLVTPFDSGARAAMLTGVVGAGTTLASGDELASDNGRYRFAVQGDGNAVVYSGGRALWSSGTAGSGPVRLVVQQDGNLVLYAQSSGRPVWASDTFGSSAQLLMQDDGNLVLYLAAAARWYTGVDPGPASLSAPEALEAGEQVSSPDGRFRLVMQADGNLVGYGPSGVGWATGTAGHAGAWLSVQSDGNLVVYSPAGEPLWWSGTQAAGPATLVLQDDANLVLYAGSPLWSRRLAFASTVRTLTSAERASMTGVTWRTGCPVGLSELRAVSLTYWDFAGQPRDGTLVVHADVAADVVPAFRAMYDSHYPIRRMIPIEAYGGSDDASMAADNTSAFNCRTVAGTTSWSRHAYGRAIDINPVENPYVSGGSVSPSAGAAYVNRSNPHPAVLRASSVAVREFEARGWTWGGRWTSPIDYQHVQR